MSLRTRLTLWKKRLPGVLAFLGNVLATLTAADVIPHIPPKYALPLFGAAAIVSAWAKSLDDCHGIEVKK